MTSYLFMIYLMHPIAQSFVTAPSWFGGGGGQLTPQGTAQNLHISHCSTVQVHLEQTPLLYRKGNRSESERLKVKAQAVSPNRKWVRQTAQIRLSTPSFTSTSQQRNKGHCLTNIIFIILTLNLTSIYRMCNPHGQLF